MLGVIGPSLAGRSMMVFLQEHAGLASVPTSNGRAAVDPEGSQELRRRNARRASSAPRWSGNLTCRFEAKLHCLPAVKRPRTVRYAKARCGHGPMNRRTTTHTALANR